MSRASPFPSSVSPSHVPNLNAARRLAALDRTELMDTVPEEEFDRAVRLANAALGMPVGLLAFVDGKRQFFKAHRGLAPEMAAAGETPLTHSFCQYVVTTDRPLAVSDAREHPLLRDNRAVADLEVVAYLGVPIHAPDGQVLGSFCAIDSEPHAWTERDLDVLHDIAGMIETEVKLRHEGRRRELVTRELDHRVKNLFAVVLSIVSLTARERGGEDAALATVHERIHALSRAHAIADNRFEDRTTDLGGIAQAVLAPHAQASERVTIEGPSVVLPMDHVTPVALILHELATNAAKHGALAVPEGRIDIAWTQHSNADQTPKVELRWVESGVPVRDKPEDEGFGSVMMRAAAMQMTGNVEREWTVDGLQVVIAFPIDV